ncbi:hypothetical protein [Bacillus sp. FJAT-50079]|uniref:hypothetical protein n=1 Tax=Bacillus sp. FJAT-50079 TaxID=2833577 RepID=UPI001BCA61BC|nr:hypothetical protein [Bacillus sp. FJAT-50079]MBS4208100.1 hypothetical protein [Bacillus sp. FJAT-50079]
MKSHAAIVWAASGFGIAIGTGDYMKVACGFILIVSTVSFLPFLIREVIVIKLK